MTVVRMVQVSIDEVIDMVAVRYGWVSATWSVNVSCFVSRADVTAGTSRGVRFGDIQRMFFYLSRACWVVQVSIVQVVDVTVVFDCGMSTTFTVFVIVMIVVVSHGFFSRVKLV